MARNYIHTLFTERTRALQSADGSREAYARMEAGADGSADQLGAAEAGFIAARDSFYLASVTSDGWPYLQHRGGPPGFLKVLEGNRLGWADYRGNRQHVSTANLQDDARLSLFLMDYPNRRRLKLIGRGSVVAAAQDPDLVTALMPPGYKAVAERAYLVEVEGFDWNCPQHITPRFTAAEISDGVRPLHARIAELEAELAHLKGLNP